MNMNYDELINYIIEKEKILIIYKSKSKFNE